MNDLEKRRRLLISLEDRFKRVIESDSDQLESQVKRGLSIGIVVGASLFVGYRVYKSLSGGSEKKKKNKEVPTAEPIRAGLMNSAKQRIAAVLFSLLYSEISERLRKGKEEVEHSLTEEKD